MGPSEFKDWRRGLGMSQKAAGQELGLSTLTIQQYERGFRYDNFKPFPIPRSVELACKDITNRVAREKGILTLEFDTISDASMGRILDCLMKRGIHLVPKNIMSFRRDNFMPFSSEIFAWLTTNASDQGYMFLNVNDKAFEDSGVVVLHFFDRVDAMRFAVEFSKPGTSPAP
jgi:transcriptional regulator with XRE-family HTH domain